MSNVHWLKTINNFRRVEGDFGIIDKVPVGVYNIGLSMQGWYLERFADKFVFDYKVYGLQSEFCDYVVKTFENTTGNLGIMLTGTKGTGKTVTAKMLANKFNLPIIIVKDMGDNNQGLIEYLNGFNFDCVLFLDEFEKNFSDEDSTILQIMDGVYNIGYRKIFLLTTNYLNVNENLIGRPSRIRYVKRFGNLNIKTVEEYLDDALLVPEARQDIIDFIDSLSISTIDILKTIVNEVNIHGVDSLEKCKDFFNVNRLSYEYRGIKGCIDYDLFIGYPSKYNIDSFLKDVEKYKDRFTIPAPKFLGEIPQEEWTEEQRKAYNEYCEHRSYSFNGMQYYNATADKKFVHLKPGDLFEEEKIIFIDKKKNVVITRSTYDNGIILYQVSNPSEKPSLYSKSEIADLIY
jgi:hypothetical protein